MDTRVTVSIDESLLAEVDKARGDVPRSVWIEKAIRGFLNR